MENRFFATIYRFTGATFLGPKGEEDLAAAKQEFVIAFDPPQKVDPRDLYIYVSDGYNTYSVTKKTVEKIDTVYVLWERKKFMTHNQEVGAKLAAMNKCFNAYKQSEHNFPPGTLKPKS